jgi:hypothetical protein
MCQVWSKRLQLMAKDCGLKKRMLKINYYVVAQTLSDTILKELYI